MSNDWKLWIVTVYKELPVLASSVTEACKVGEFFVEDDPSEYHSDASPMSPEKANAWSSCLPWVCDDAPRQETIGDWSEKLSRNSDRREV